MASGLITLWEIDGERVETVSDFIFWGSKSHWRWWLQWFWSPPQSLPGMQETWVQSLGGEDPLEKEMAIHSSILAWKIPWMEEPGRLQSMGSQRVGHNWVTSLFFFFATLRGKKWRVNQIEKGEGSCQLFWLASPTFTPHQAGNRDVCFAWVLQGANTLYHQHLRVAMVGRSLFPTILQMF